MLRPPRPIFRISLPVLAALWLLIAAATPVPTEAESAGKPQRGGTINMSAYADAEVWEGCGSFATTPQTLVSISPDALSCYQSFPSEISFNGERAVGLSENFAW